MPPWRNRSNRSPSPMLRGTGPGPEFYPSLTADQRAERWQSASASRRVRSRGTANWAYGPWSLGWTCRFISGARVIGDTPADLFAKAPGTFYQDFDLTRYFGGLTVMAGLDNLSDKRPPTLINGQTNTKTSTYNVLGRTVWGGSHTIFDQPTSLPNQPCGPKKCYCLTIYAPCLGE